MARGKRRERGIKGRPWYRKRNDTWYIDYEGKQLAIKDGEGRNVKGAGNGELAQQAWVLMQAHMMAPMKGDDNAVRLVFGKYLDCVNVKSPDAYPQYQRTLVSFADSLPSREFAVKDLTSFHVEEWFGRHPSWKSSTTQATYLAILLAALNWAAKPERRLIKTNPLDGITKPRRRSRSAKALISKEAHQAFLDHIPEDLAVVAKILRDTGTRPSNICRVTRAQCDWDDGGWWFAEENVEEGQRVHKTANKTEKGMFQPIPAEVMNLCRELAEKYPTGPLFRRKNGKRWTSDLISSRFYYWKNKLAAAGVPMPDLFIAYGYRHTLATEMLEAGVPDTDVAVTLGHEGTATLHKSYSKVKANRKRTSNTLRDFLKDRDHSRQLEGPTHADTELTG